MVDTAHEKEQKAKETINSLQEEITRLTILVEEGSGPSQGKEYKYVCPREEESLI